MKVTNKVVDNKNIDKSLDIKNSKKAQAQNKANTKIDLNKASSDGVKVTLSDKAKEFKEIKAAVNNTPDIDTAKINRIKTALKEGKFDINYDKLAEKIVEHDMMYDLLS